VYSSSGTTVGRRTSGSTIGASDEFPVPAFANPFPIFERVDLLRLG
jgi:hypothetical protein